MVTSSSEKINAAEFSSLAFRPGPQAHNAGITPGWEYLPDDDQLITRGEMRELEDRIAALERVMRLLAERVGGQR